MTESGTSIPTTAQPVDSAREIKETWFLWVAIVFAYFVVLQPSIAEGWLDGDTPWAFVEGIRLFQLVLSPLIYAAFFGFSAAKMFRSAGWPKAATAAKWLAVGFPICVVPMAFGMGSAIDAIARASGFANGAEGQWWIAIPWPGFIAAAVLARATRSPALGLILMGVTVATTVLFWLDPWIESHTFNRRRDYYPEFESLPSMLVLWTVCAISAVGWWSLRKVRSSNPPSPD